MNAISEILNDKEFFPPNFAPDTKLAKIISEFLNLAFYIAVFLAFFWLVWGAFQYIFAGGDKQRLADARKRIVWAIVGLIIVALAFSISQFAGQILNPKPGNVPLPGFSLVSPVYAAIPEGAGDNPYSGVNIGQKFGFANVNSLGQGVDNLTTPAFSIALAAVVFYFLLGAFKYLTSAGDKEALASAQKMIIHAIVGFVILMFAFLLLQFLFSQLFGINNLQLIKGG